MPVLPALTLMVCLPAGTLRAYLYAAGSPLLLMSWAALNAPPSTLTLRVGEPPDCPPRATSTTSPWLPKSTVAVAVAVLSRNLSAWPLEYIVSFTTPVPPVGGTAKFSPSTRGATSAASAFFSVVPTTHKQGQQPHQQDQTSPQHYTPLYST